MLIKIIKKPLRVIWKILHCLKSYYLDRRARKYLKDNTKKRHMADKPMKVGFIVFEPETWDKLDPIFNELKARENIIVNIIIVPSFDQELKLTTHYGRELGYFRGIDPNSILAYEDGKWIDIEKDGYDYIFYQDPYNEHMPPLLTSDNVVKFAKISYLPYGMVGSEVFILNNMNKAFFRNVYCEFTDNQEIQELFKQRYKKSINKGYQHFELLGYPAMMRYSEYEYRNQMKSVLWTPRWSYHPVVGGSNFIEYKDGFLELAKEWPDITFNCRPHPMMFRNFINEGIFTEEDKAQFFEKCKEYGIEISEGKDLDADFYNADILITDFSSIIPQYFMTKRPIIYCSSHIPLNDFFGELALGMYVARTWDEVINYINSLTEGNDYLYHKRVEIVEKLSKIHAGSEKRIVDYLVNDYEKSKMSKS